MQTRELKQDFYWTGIMDPGLRVFDIIMHTEYGTTYNSYVLKTEETTILFETAKAVFLDEYLEALGTITDIGQIDYLILDHTEPDHAGSVEYLLEKNPGLKIIATGCALNFLKHIVNRDFYGIAVKDNETMRIGGKTLRFLSVPNLHWPDTMYTYIEEDKILVTCDSFGAHYGTEGILRSEIQNEKAYLEAARYYFDNILGPFKSYMRKALERVRALPVSLICTGHGPVLDTKLEEVFSLYEEWCREENPNMGKTVIIPYVSAYGYTRELAERIADGIRDSGDVTVRLYDMVEADSNQVLRELSHADGILFGTPTILGEALKPIWDLTASLFPVTHGGTYAAAFGSYGWSGEGVSHLTERLRQLKFRVLDEGLRVRFKPGKTGCADAYEYGFRFGCLVQEDGGGKPKASEKRGGRKLVKCLVCGEIFDSSLETCPVCGVGREYFVEVEEEEVAFRNNTEEHFVILGNGIAGLSAAEAIRKRNQTASIVMVSDEPYDTYNRPMLTKALLSEPTPEQAAVHEKEWYESQRIFRILGKRAVSLDPERHEVELEDGTKLSFSKLIYALGAECMIPPIKGAEQEGVIAIRRLADVRRIHAALPKLHRIVVIGGGVLGLEAAWEFCKAKCQVTVVEAAPYLMPRRLDERAANILQETAEAEGIRILTGEKAAEITKVDEEKTETSDVDALSERGFGVMLESGEFLPADLVICSVGIRANLDLARQAGIECGRAVLVNGRMETSRSGIYACGDCAEYEGMNYALWNEASEQGKTAGANAAGEEKDYEEPPMGLSFHGLNTALFSIGTIGSHEKSPCRIVEELDEARNQFKKYFYVNGRLKGAILLGNLADMAKVTEAITGS